MTDERLAELRQELQAKVDEQTSLKRAREDAHSRIKQLADEVQRLNLSRRELDVPYKNATERVAELVSMIQAEERSRAEQAAKKRAAEAAAQKAKEEAEAAAAAQQILAAE